MRRVAVTVSDSDGRFEFGSRGAAVGIVVRRLGYRVANVSLQPPDVADPIRIRLEPTPVALAGIASVAARTACPLPDDANARALVRTAQSRYHTPAQPVVFHSLATFQSGRADSGADGEPAAAPRRIWLAATTAAWPGWRDQIFRVGYAARLIRGVTERSVVWQYVPLDQEYAAHFADEMFARNHDFRMSPAPVGGWTVAFCPKRGSRATGIDGILTISADTLIAAASWNFRTPRPNEEAGGEVDFLSPDLSQASLLLPLASRFWRRAGAGRFYVQRAEYLEWRVHPGDRPVPLPRELIDQGS